MSLLLFFSGITAAFSELLQILSQHTMLFGIQSAWYSAMQLFYTSFSMQYYSKSCYLRLHSHPDPGVHQRLLLILSMSLSLSTPRLILLVLVWASMWWAFSNDLIVFTLQHRLALSKAPLLLWIAAYSVIPVTVVWVSSWALLHCGVKHAALAPEGKLHRGLTEATSNSLGILPGDDVVVRSFSLLRWHLHILSAECHIGYLALLLFSCQWMSCHVLLSAVAMARSK